MNHRVKFPDNNAITDQAADWLIRLDDDKSLTKQERLQLADWINQSSRHRHELYRLAGVWEKLNVLTDLAMPLNGNKHTPDTPVYRRQRWLPLAGVAAILLVAIFTGNNWLRQDSYEQMNQSYETATGKQLTLPLADSSSVILNTDSKVRIEYSADFRDVYLQQGEAFFSVAKDNSRPFRVFAGNGRIDAVGTAFSVYLKNEGVDVTVTEGVVNLVALESQIISSQADSRGVSRNDNSLRLISLGVGQFASILNKIQPGVVIEFTDVIDLESRDLSRKISWTRGSLIFSGESLADVVAEVSRYTNINIEFSDQSLGEIRVGGVFPAGETEIMFDVLENTFDLEVISKGDNHVLISEKNK